MLNAEIDQKLDEYLLQAYDTTREDRNVKDKTLIDRSTLIGYRPSIAKLIKKEEIAEVVSLYDKPQHYDDDTECLDWPKQVFHNTKGVLKPTNKKSLEASLKRTLNGCTSGLFDPESKFCKECTVIPTETLSQSVNFD